MSCQFKKFFILFLIGFWFCLYPQTTNYFALPASAFNHQQTVSSNEIGGYSIENLLVIDLKDEVGNVWQTILAKSDEEADLVLRLVGDPLAAIDRDRPLQILQQDDILLETKDLEPSHSLAFHTAQYSLQDILSKLPDQDISLTFYLTSNRQINLKLSPEAIAQWQKFAKTQENDLTWNAKERPQNFNPAKITFLLA